MERFTWFALALMGCAPATPPPPAAPAVRAGTEIPVPFQRAWDAVIDHFASHSVPIRTIDRSSGLIVTEPLRVGEDAGTRWGWCGWLTADTRQRKRNEDDADWLAIPPTAGSYNVLVRGDSTRATVRATVRWTRESMGRGALQTRECQSLGVFELELEGLIAARATGK